MGHFSNVAMNFSIDESESELHDTVWGKLWNIFRTLL